MISVIVPTYNRGEGLTAVVAAVHGYLKNKFPVFEIIVVDDGSRDHTRDALKQLAQDYLEVQGLVLGENRGQQMATLAGIRKAQYAYTVTLDDDLEYDLTAIEKIVEQLDLGYDVVYVEKGQPRKQAYRAWGTLLKEWVFFAFLNKPRDIHLTSFRGMNSYVRDYVAEDCLQSVYISARILQLPLKIAMVTSDFVIAQQVKSNYNLLKLAKLLLQTLYHYKVRPNSGQGIQSSKQYRIKEVFE